MPPGLSEGYRAAAPLRNRTVAYRPAELLRRVSDRFGAVLTTRAGRVRYAYLIGPEANRFVFANSALFRWREAFEALIPVDGPTALIVSDGPDHRRRRRLVQPAFGAQQVERYVPIVAENADRVIRSWRPGRRVDVYQQLRSAIRRATIRSLFGERLAADADAVGAALQPMLDLVSRPSLVAWQRRLRTPAWRRAMAARSDVDGRVLPEIARAGRSEPGADVLATLVHGRDEHDDGLTDPEVRDQVVSLIAAGYETTSAALAWAVYALLSTTGCWDRAAAEVRAVLGDRRPTGRDLPALTYLNGVVHETLRLYPPAVVVARWVVENFTFEGRRIRAGTTLLCSPYVTHRMPRVWPEPTRFRPERWDPTAPDHGRPSPAEFLPFGGGPHRCVGAGLAVTEMTVTLARLLAQASLWLPAQRVGATDLAAMRPRHGLHVDVLDVG